MSDIFSAPSKPAWIKRFRKPAVCNKNLRFLCLYFPAPFPRLKTPQLHIYSSQRCCRVIYTGSNSSICENAVPSIVGNLLGRWIYMLQAGGSLLDWRIETRQACGCFLLSGIVFLRAGGNMKSSGFQLFTPVFLSPNLVIFPFCKKIFFLCKIIWRLTSKVLTFGQ